MHYLEKELYELIKERSEIFDFIQESALDGLWYWDLEHPDDEWMNRKFWTTLGYDPATMPHKVSSWQDIIHPDDLETARQKINEYFQNPDRPYDQIIRYRHNDGNTMWIRCRGMAVRDASGRPIRMMGAHTDVTEVMLRNEHYAQTEQELRDNIGKLERTREMLEATRLQAEDHVARIASAIENTTDSIWALDENYDIIYTNKVYQTDFLNAFGVLLEPGVNQLQALPENLQPFWKPRYDRGLSGERAIFEDEVPTAYGNVFVEVMMNPIRIEGRVVGISCSGRDITERKQIEKKMRQSEVYHRSLLKVIPDMMFIIGNDGKYLDFKADPEKLYVKPEMFLGKTIREVMPSNVVDTHLNAVKKAMSTGEVVSYEYSLSLHDGEHHFLARIVAFGDDRTVTLVTDITDRVNDMNRIASLLDLKEKQNQRLTSFTHIVSHNLRSHTANLQGVLNLLEMESPELRENQYLSMIRQTTRQLKETIHDLNEVLDTTFTNQQDYREFDLHDVMVMVCRNVAFLAQKSEVQVINEIPPNTRLHAVPAYVEGIMLNLVTNAIKYKKGGQDDRVQISYELREVQHHIHVRDNGLGIDLDRHADKLFRMYKTFHTHHESKGLGLFICKNQAEAMGGDIMVASKEGAGSVFTLVLPTLAD
jgi:PAS domain S-box-containing protein